MPGTGPTDHYEVFIALLREARLSSGVTQEELASLTGWRQTDVSKTERGVRRIDVVELREWLRATGVPFSDFAIELDQRLASLSTARKQLARKAPSKGKRR